MRKNVLIGLSGGPSTAINASMAGVIRAAAASARYGAVYGALHGIAAVSYTHLLPACNAATASGLWQSFGVEVRIISTLSSASTSSKLS